MSTPARAQGGDQGPGLKRMRWATQRVKSVRVAANKRTSIMKRFQKGGSVDEKKRISGTTGSSDDSQPNATQDASSENGSEEEKTPRNIYFNQPLPPEEADEHGGPIVPFPRNKIRTARYTPLTFVPKNLWLQFHNIANVYFLFLIILSGFAIFGASNPGLGAVPLIVILAVTGIKDAIEDYRRSNLDDELNNLPVHRLVDWDNVNASNDSVGPWRRLKKAITHGFAALSYQWKHRKDPKAAKGDIQDSEDQDDTRPSIDTLNTQPKSRGPSRQSRREAGELEAIPMREVTSPMKSSGAQSPFYDAPTSPQTRPTGFSFEETGARPSESLVSPKRISLVSNSAAQPLRRTYGNLIDPFKEATGTPRFKRDFWKNVQVGDFVRIYSDDQIPADLVVLATSDPDGACYVETKNLDGETNLKVRNALHCGSEMRHAKDCERTSFVVESEPPHANLYSYSGAIRWTERDPQDPEKPGMDMTEPIGINNLLLRGSSLRNTEWALGVVIFTGDESKIMLNSGISLSKRSRIQRDLNWNVLYNFLILFCMSLVSGIIEGVIWGTPNNSIAVFEFGSIGGTPGLNGFITFWSAVILFQNLVPISLYITLEIIRTAQAFFIFSDTFMYYDKIDYPCTPKSWNISDDLGQIEYIFSDKTGTLTQNVMEFKKCTVNGVPYGEAYTEAQAGMQRRQGIDTEAEAEKAFAQIAIDRERMIKDIRAIHYNPYFQEDDLTFVAPDFIEDLQGHSGDGQKKANQEFLLALSLCHSVLTEKTPGDPPKIEFQAQSPDEAALVGTARDCGYTVMGRSNDGIILDIQGVEQEYQVLNILEFNSTRKRMSAIIRMPDNRIILYCKGADSIIYSRLKKGEQRELRRSTAEHLEMMAREGLRTLCIAQKEIPEEEYQAWNKRHDVAAAAVQDREDKLEEVSDAIERDLMLMGGTAIEDRLQDGVPDTIQLLGRAGIKLWVLTGDKVETAINIGFSCNLLDNAMDLIVFRIEDGDMDTARIELDQHLATFNLEGTDKEVAKARKDHEPPAPTHAIVIDGDSLKLMLDDELKQKFLLLCKQCKSVLCCRVSPSQKAAVVQMVKHGLDVMTLSIGDGANDVAMIQEADVGVGIAGEEGRQAVMSSDYAIGQFRFLSRLILVHGRWSYRRLGETIANFFYKNIVWTFALFWYQIYNNFDCSYLFDYTYVLLFNLAFSSLPIIFMGILDQDVDDKVSLAVPQLYRRGIERKEWTLTKFWLYMADGIYQSVMVFFIAYLLFQPAVGVTHSGLDVNDTRRIGVYVANACVVVVNVYILMNMYRWDWLMMTLVAFSILLIFFWTGVFSSFTSSSYFYHAAAQVYGEPTFWAVTLLTVAICLAPRFTIKAFQKIYLPYDIDVIREQVRQGKFKHLEEVQPGAVASKVLAQGSPADELPTASSATGKAQVSPKNANIEEDMKPFYPPSETTATHTANQLSDATSDLGRRASLAGRAHSMEEVRPMSPIDSPSRPLSPFSQRSTPFDPERVSGHRPRPSFDRLRSSMDRTRPSFESSRDFTSAHQLTRVESSHSDTHIPLTPVSTRGAGRREFPLSPLRNKPRYDAPTEAQKQRDGEL